MLFRQQALAEQRFRLYGDVSVPCRAPYVACSAAVAAICAALVHAAITLTYTERATARGYLVPEGGIVRIRAPRAGVVDATFVELGQVVHKGDRLLQVRSETRSAADTTFASATAVNLERRREEIAAQVALVDKKEALTLEGLRAERQTLRATLAVSTEQLATQRKWLMAMQERADAYRRAGSSGAVPRMEIKRLEADVLSGELQLHALERQRVTLLGEIERNRKLEQSARTEQLTAVAALRLQRLDLDDRMLDNDRANVEVVTAPMDATVVSQAVLPGAETLVGEELLVLAPYASPLVAHIFVPAAAIGFMQVGQRVALQYDSFPLREFGLFSGTVAEIAEFVFDRRELEVDIALTQPVFRVITRPDVATVDVHGTSVSLKSGMTLDAHVETRALSVGAWLLEPLMAFRDAPFERARGSEPGGSLR